MFPNVRLLVAATLASIVMLICGFGIFAALRVSHAPLFRSLVVAASPQPLADNAAITPLASAPWEPFDRRFEIGATDRSDAVKAFARFLARRENIESPRAASPAAPEPGAIAAKEEPIAIETPKDVPAAPGTPAEEPPAKPPPIANDAPVASLAATAPPETETPAAVAPATAAKPAPAQPAEPTPVSATAASAVTAPDNEAATQDRQSNVSTGPATQQWQSAQTRPTKARRRSLAARKADESTPGVGGPFVRAPSPQAPARD